MSKIKKVNPKTEEQDIHVGISFFINHPTAGQKVIDCSSDLESLRYIYNCVHQFPKVSKKIKILTHQILMDSLDKKAQIDEYFFKYGPLYLATFLSVGYYVHPKVFQNYCFHIELIYNDFDAAEVFTIDYDSWYKGLITRKAT